jgi:transcriptional regulator with XRE-family HTH domain
VVAPAPKFDFSVIRHLRHRHDLTIAQLSEASGVSTAVISKLERNHHTADVLALAESPFAHRTEEQSYRSGKFQFRQVRYANIVGLLGEAPAGAVVNRPEIHHDDHEVCWVISGRIHLTLPHEVCDLGPGQSIQFDAVLEHTYAAIEDSRFIILHLRKDKRY